MDKYIGRLLDNRYEILEVIGTGGMAVVYKARCHRLNRLVAIKILKDEYSQDEEFRRRFHAESQAVAMLSHPNIVAVYDVSTSADADYIVMELIDGITLKQYMEKKGVLNWKETLHFAMQIAKALEHAHSRGIVHRDIKPHNVMVLKNGSVKVADFGIARVMSKSNTLTKEALGSVHYISPEQAKGGRVDNRSDIYSLGVVMYEMMTGRPPYDGESPVAVAIQHINGGAPMPSTLNPNIPGGLEQIIMKAMAVEPNDRYPSATAMLYDMDEFRKDPTILFDFNNMPIDDATRIRTSPLQPQTPAASSTAERTAAARSRQNTQPLRQERPSAAGGTKDNRTPAPKRQTETEEESRSRTTTIAVVACSAVVVVGIVIFLVLLISGTFSGKPEQELVKVPQLVGSYYDQIDKEIDGIVIVRGPGAYDDVYERGQIMDQNPKAGEEIYKGNQVVVTVSLGPEPQEKVMEDITNLTEQEARDFLGELGLNLVILPRQEASATVEAGRIIRTDPVRGEQLTEGQTITLWISSGPEVKTAQMPKVVGLKYSTALDLLTKYGFTDVDYRSVESGKPKDEVVSQSVEKGETVSVDTKIILEISEGPAETTVPPTEPSTEPPTQPPTTQPATDPADVTVEKRVELTLPSDRTEPYTLSIRLGGERVMEDMVVQVGTYTVMVQLTGSGVQYYELYIDDQYYRTEKVDFSVNG